MLYPTLSYKNVRLKNKENHREFQSCCFGLLVRIHLKGVPSYSSRSLAASPRKLWSNGFAKLNPTFAIKLPFAWVTVSEV
jgi:hypothetical protein